MAHLPREFLGLARAFRSAIAAEHRHAVTAAERIAIPLAGRVRLRQAPSPGAFAKVAATWRDQIGSAGRLDLKITATTKRLSIEETRAGPSEFRFLTWPEGDTETALVIAKTTLLASFERFRFDQVPVATLPLHALARRYQRGWDNSDAAICGDLRALAAPHPETLAAGEDFNVDVADGAWIGNVTEIQYRGEPLLILAVRSFVSLAVSAWTATLPEAALMAPSGAGDAP
jgi:hypothetical protein